MQQTFSINWSKIGVPQQEQHVWKNYFIIKDGFNGMAQWAIVLIFGAPMWES